MDVEPIAQFDLDLGNLVATYVPAIPDEAFQSSTREDNITKFASSGVQCILDALWACKHEITLEGERVVTLPEASIVLPRTKSLPKKKELTRWEKFAQKKGIRKHKRDRLMWDETHDDWRPRYGKAKANNEDEIWAVEHKEGTDPSIDPFLQRKMDKKKRTDNNKKNQVRNLKLAQGNRIPGQVDLASAVGRHDRSTKKKRGKRDEAKSHLQVAFDIAAQSTASMGQFDKRSSNLEKETSSILRTKTKKQRVENYGNLADEKNASLRVLARTLRLAGQDKGTSFNAEKAGNVEHNRRKRQRG